VSPTVEESLLRSGPANLTPSDAFPGTEYVASLAMVRFSNPASPSATASQKRPSSREPLRCHNLQPMKNIFWRMSIQQSPDDYLVFDAFRLRGYAASA